MSNLFTLRKYTLLHWEKSLALLLLCSPPILFSLYLTQPLWLLCGCNNLSILYTLWTIQKQPELGESYMILGFHLVLSISIGLIKQSQENLVVNSSTISGIRACWCVNFDKNSTKNIQKIDRKADRNSARFFFTKADLQLTILAKPEGGWGNGA